MFLFSPQLGGKVLFLFTRVGVWRFGFFFWSGEEKWGMGERGRKGCFCGGFLEKGRKGRAGGGLR